MTTTTHSRTPSLSSRIDRLGVRSAEVVAMGGVAGIGSGGNYALSAAKALIDTDKDAETIVRKAMAIAAEICVYTNDKLTVEIIDAE